MSKRGRSARKNSRINRQRPNRPVAPANGDRLLTPGTPISHWAISPVADQHSLRLTAECVADIATCVARAHKLAQRHHLTPRVFQRECRDISTRLRKLILPSAEELLKQCFVPTMHSLTSASWNNSSETLTQWIGNATIEYTVGEHPETLSATIPSEHEHETIIGPLYGLKRTGKQTYQFSDPFNWQTTPLPLRRWMNLKVLRVDDVSIDAESILRMMANKEGAHAELDEMATSNPALPVPIKMGDQDDEPYRMANVINFSDISFVQIFTLLVGFYLARMMRASLKHIPPELTRFNGWDEMSREIMETPTKLPSLTMKVDRPYFMGAVLQHSPDAERPFKLVGDYQAPSQTVVRIP